MTILNDEELDNKITNFMSRKMEVFPELRHQPEVHIEEPSERGTISQWLRDMVKPAQSARL